MAVQFNQFNLPNIPTTYFTQVCNFFDVRPPGNSINLTDTLIIQNGNWTDPFYTIFINNDESYPSLEVPSNEWFQLVVTAYNVSMASIDSPLPGGNFLIFESDEVIFETMSWNSGSQIDLTHSLYTHSNGTEDSNWEIAISTQIAPQPWLQNYLNNVLNSKANETLFMLIEIRLATMLEISTSEETHIQIFYRVLQDTSSFLSPIISLSAIVVYYFVPRFIYREKREVWIDKDVRESILYMKEHSS